MRLNIFSEHTYTLEMIIQAGHKGMAVTSVPIKTNEYLRPSRLVKSVSSYIQSSVFTILRIFMTYNPLRFFLVLGTIPFAVGFLLGVRWLLLYWSGTPRAHVPSLVLAAILMLMGFQLWILGLVADLTAINRKMLEDIQIGIRREKLDARKHQPPV